jgi:hypothetical protein
MMTKEKAIERARKLMAMAADSSSPNEAAIAAKRARSIIDKFQLSNDQLESCDYSVGEQVIAKKNIPSWLNSLGVYIAQLNDCIATRSGGTLKFKGLTEDVEVANFMFNYIREAGIRAHRKDKSVDPFHHKSSFLMGFTSSIGKRVKEILKERSDDSKSESGKDLVLVKKAMVEAHFNQVGAYKQSRFNGQESSYGQGHAAGDKVNITTGLGATPPRHALA